MQLLQETIRQILVERNPKTPDDIMNALREMFREVLEEALVVEMEEHLGYGMDLSRKPHTQDYGKECQAGSVGERSKAVIIRGMQSTG